MNKKGEIIQGGSFKDSRGTLTFFNDFKMDGVKRFYMIDHPDTAIIRAWQGHKKEEKWFCVVAGSFKVVLVQPDNWEKPSKQLETEEFILAAEDRKILHVPGNYANGFKALEPGSQLIVFSNFTTAESATDNFRFEAGMWYDWSKE